MKYFFRYIFEILITPKKAFIELIKDYNKSKFSFFMIIMLFLIYGSAFICLFFFKAVFPVKPFLNISRENFFLVSLIFGLPSLLMIYLMCSGFIQIAAKRFEGVGLFEDTFTVVIFSLSVPLFFFWLYYFISILTIITTGNAVCLSLNILRIFMIITLLLQFYILTNAVRILHIIDLRYAFFIGLTALIIFWFFFIIFFI